MAEPPPARGVRLDWPDLPQRVRGAIEQRFGAAVVTAVTQPGGFSPGLAARVETEDGRRAFVKAVGREPNADAPRMHRREARIVASLPLDAPVSRLLWSNDDEETGWVVLAFEDIEGSQPAQPWRMAELERVLDALAALSEMLTPSPVPEAVAGSVGRFGLFASRWWERLRDRPAGLEAWPARHVEALAAIEAGAPAAVTGETLLHLDIRADNVLLTPERVVIVDWPHARVGAAWVDLVCLAPSVAMQGGPSPEALLRSHPAAHTAEGDALTAAIVALAGFFTWHALQPPPPGLPTLRAFQAAQGAVACAWVAERTGLF